MKRKEIRRLQRYCTLDVTRQFEFDLDSHEHVVLTDGRTEIVKTKKDNANKIYALLRKGWQIVERND